MGFCYENGWGLEMPLAQHDHKAFDEQVADVPDGLLPLVAHQYRLGLAATTPWRQSYRQRHV